MSFNDEQVSYMNYLATVAPNEKCYCGWFMVKECPHCKGRATCADKLEIRCQSPKCLNYPHLGGRPTIIHNIACTTPDYQPVIPPRLLFCFTSPEESSK